MQIFVRGLKGQIIVVEVEASATVATLKAEIHGRSGIPPPLQSLEYMGKPLRDGFALTDLGVRSRAAMFLTRLPVQRPIQIPDGPVAVKVTMLLRGEWIEMDVDIEPGDTVARIKERVEEIEGIPPRWQWLICQGMLMADEKTPWDYDIVGGSVLSLIVRCTMHIYVRNPKDQIIVVEVDASATVDTLKAKIHDRAGIPPPRQRLEYLGKPLSDGFALYDLGIRSGAALFLTRLIHDGPVGVKVRILLRGELTEIDMDIEPRDTVARFKERVEEREGIPPPRQLLIFKGQLMEDEKTPWDYNIVGGSVLNLVVRCPARRSFIL